jgi:hypothetical protein
MTKTLDNQKVQLCGNDDDFVWETGFFNFLVSTCRQRVKSKARKELEVSS